MGFDGVCRFCYVNNVIVGAMHGTLFKATGIWQSTDLADV